MQEFIVERNGSLVQVVVHRGGVETGWHARVHIPCGDWLSCPALVRGRSFIVRISPDEYLTLGDGYGDAPGSVGAS